MKVLFIFLDGVGLGVDDPDVNPFARPIMLSLETLLGGHKLIADGQISGPERATVLVESQYASLLSLDACLGIEGLPQSATGQASLLTGLNVPAMLGFHEGPKPTPPILALLKNGTMISELEKRGRFAALVNAFPNRYFDNIDTGYRIPGVIALSTQEAGFRLKTTEDLRRGTAISADFTAEGWHTHLGILDTPILSLPQAGQRLSELASESDLTIFEYWLTDVAGHHQDMPGALTLLQSIDTVLGSLVQSWDFNAGIILLTSDHGNLEDLSTRRHTRNEVPLLIIGSHEQRKHFFNAMVGARSSNDNLNLTDFAPAILKYIG